MNLWISTGSCENTSRMKANLSPPQLRSPNIFVGRDFSSNYDRQFKSSNIFVGRGFSHDIQTATSSRL
jgi:hypothetical protein